MASVAGNVRPGRGDVSVGSVLSRAFALIGAAPLSVLGLSLLIGAAPRVALEWGVGSLARAGVGPNLIWLTIAGWSGSSMAGILLSVFVQGAIVRVALAVGDGRRAGVGEMMLALARRLPALLVVAVVTAVGTSVGYVLLFVPGMLLATIWAAAAPAVVAERLGPFAALARSRWLTRGHRWTVFGVLTLIFVLSWVASGVYAATVLAIFGVHGTSLVGGAPTIGWALGDLGFKTLTTAVWASARAALYVELRDAREGPGEAQLATIFA